MLRSRSFQSLICLGLGLVLGLVAATARFDPLKQAAADPSAPKPTVAESPAAPLETKTAPPGFEEGLVKDTLLAQAEGKRATTQAATRSVASGKKPNILVIWGDDIGYWNVSMNNQGMMGYKTPNIDRIAKGGAMFTDWYGQQSCTAGRACFITGQVGFRTGLLKVGLPGAKEGLKARDVTIAELLKAQGYMTAQFGKNHLGDADSTLPTAHGFDDSPGLVGLRSAQPRAARLGGEGAFAPARSNEPRTGSPHRTL